MRIMNVMLLCLGIICVGTTTGLTAQPVAAPADARDVEVWSQTPNYAGAIVSQDDIGPFERDALVVEDFESPGDAAITSVQWWGRSDAAPGCMDHFRITVYAHLDHCQHPDEGTVLSQQIVSTYTEAPAGDYRVYSADVDPILMDAGRKYWIAITAVQDTETCDHWYWAQSDEVWNCDSRIISDHWGFWNWQPVYVAAGFDEAYHAQALRLGTDGAVANRSSSWSAIKAQFR